MRTSSKHQVKVKTTPSISRGGGCISQNNTPTAFTDKDEVRRNCTSTVTTTDGYVCRVAPVRGRVVRDALLGMTR